MLCDKHVSKMILETAQMLSTAARSTHGTPGIVRYLDKEGNEKYKARPLLLDYGEYDGMWDHERNPHVYWDVHHKHPCTLWARENKWNWKWLCHHGLSMSDEFEYRYNNRHKSNEVIRFIYETNMAPKGKPYSFTNWMTPFAQAMPDQYKHKDAVTAYRNYYLGEKKRFAKWTNRNPPKWWKEAV